MTQQQPPEILAYLSKQTPELKKILQGPPIPHITRPERICIRSAVLKCVTGQMLSRVAANTIYSRLWERARQEGLRGPWKLDAELLKVCGLSARKVRTIASFLEKYNRTPDAFEAWAALDYPELENEVRQHWGMSSWTAQMLAIFHFGSEDVFPANDGTIQRAAKRLAIRPNQLNELTARARPYRSYLALYMWRAIDEALV